MSRWSSLTLQASKNLAIDSAADITERCGSMTPWPHTGRGWCGARGRLSAWLGRRASGCQRHATGARIVASCCPAACCLAALAVLPRGVCKRHG